MRPTRHAAAGFLALAIALSVSVVSLFVLSRPCLVGSTPQAPQLEPGSVLTEREFNARYAGPQVDGAICTRLTNSLGTAQLLRIDLSWYFGFFAPAILAGIGWRSRASTIREVSIVAAPTAVAILALGADVHGLALFSCAVLALLILGRFRERAVA